MSLYHNGQVGHTNPGPPVTIKDYSSTYRLATRHTTAALTHRRGPNSPTYPSGHSNDKQISFGLLPPKSAALLFERLRDFILGSLTRAQSGTQAIEDLVHSEAAENRENLGVQRAVGPLRGEVFSTLQRLETW